MSLKPNALHNASVKINQAMEIAIDCHHGILRKDGTPFLMHPVSVWRELLDVGISDADIQAAALLHDVLEERVDIHADCLRRIRETLGEPIAGWVLFLTDDMSLSSSERKQLQLAKYRDAPLETRMIKLADRASNLVAPPPLWGPDKIRDYAAHSIALLDAMKGTHTELERRLIARLRLAPWNVGIRSH